MATHRKSLERREPMSATPSGPMNSSVTAIPSGMRSSAWKKQRFIETSTRPNATASRSSARGRFRIRGRKSRPRTSPPKTSRSATTPVGVRSSKSDLATAAPSCTDRTATMTSAGAGTRSSSAAWLRFTNLSHAGPGDRRRGLDPAAGVTLTAADLEAAARTLPGLVAPFHRGAAAETALGHGEQSGLGPGRF